MCKNAVRGNRKHKFDIVLNLFVCLKSVASPRFCQDLLRSLDICLLCPMPIKCCQGQAKITQSLEITVCASAQISLRRLCFSSICVDLMSARQSGLVRRIAAKNKHFFQWDLAATWWRRWLIGGWPGAPTRPKILHGLVFCCVACASPTKYKVTCPTKGYLSFRFFSVRRHRGVRLTRYGGQVRGGGP